MGHRKGARESRYRFAVRDSRKGVEGAAIYRGRPRVAIRAATTARKSPRSAERPGGHMTNPALEAAQQAQTKINEALDAGRSFRLEAGAGAGKTYSLVAALKRVIAERGPALVQSGQKVACITFTEVARNEIAQEIEDHPAILVDTIHGFSWNFLRQFQKALRDSLAEM